MKAILLAGGTGSRLYPLTQVSSKQLQAVFDKPMIYYPLTVLIASGVRELCLISNPEHLPRYQKLLGNGSQWGISIAYREQARPEGIAQAFLIAADFIGSDSVILMLGDNIFSGGDDFPRAASSFEGGATIFAYHVKDPERYGVVEFDRNGRAISIEEKPGQPKSSYAVPGVYIYDNEVVDFARAIKPSARGELEITDVNLEYLRRGKLQVRRLSRGFAWLDAGTSTALHEASSYIEAIERRQGVKIGCPEEAALVRGFLDIQRFEALLDQMPACDYRTYLSGIAATWRKLQG
ncbi:glucose-1-phosphate thymidylyltransferase RfbA [Bordetella avium]|uniref:Glucose-1-phosphate thymidylyltransferase n=1 Tax=Bordetella avium (strain 197N) TaxID=360910 RepID=Q2L336_BORA1|nr:glucose-1-phosphate thymidylyltransferase RfbA [Bordetella avium]AZY48729.1 glucose-1-phosphate thymidylyltransferase [Bordetella avium]AZY52108.1 glucose-1-phosphate thymidylyltransferase [Bordetella avium]RIQ14035.1 glucose-1-phosphate thymidylyltransferase [Bordetella avium]RIQ54587.1 glucose-1-phosphate thymidylyltransferase [Bordetella avium]RIQ57111.1 glucose-1-phosphate thymidylyltransferase [Bordetella avium]